MNSMTQYETENPPNLAELVTGIVDDAQEVIKQQLNLFQAELKTAARNHVGMAIAIVLGLVALLIAGISLALAAGFGMASAWQIPLGGAFAIVGGILLVATAAFAWWAWSQFSAIKISAGDQSGALKETNQWTTKK